MKDLFDFDNKFAITNAFINKNKTAAKTKFKLIDNNNIQHSVSPTSLTNKLKAFEKECLLEGQKLKSYGQLLMLGASESFSDDSIFPNRLGTGIKLNPLKKIFRSVRYKAKEKFVPTLNTDFWTKNSSHDKSYKAVVSRDIDWKYLTYFEGIPDGNDKCNVQLMTAKDCQTNSTNHDSKTITYSQSRQPSGIENLNATNKSPKVDNYDDIDLHTIDRLDFTFIDGLTDSGKGNASSYPSNASSTINTKGSEDLGYEGSIASNYETDSPFNTNAWIDYKLGGSRCNNAFIKHSRLVNNDAKNDLSTEYKVPKEVFISNPVYGAPLSSSTNVFEPIYATPSLNATPNHIYTVPFTDNKISEVSKIHPKQPKNKNLYLLYDNHDLNKDTKGTLEFPLPHLDQEETIFVGRQWLFRQIIEKLELTDTYTETRGAKGILLTGKSGTGKTAIVREILKRSPTFGKDVAAACSYYEKSCTQYLNQSGSFGTNGIYGNRLIFSDLYQTKEQVKSPGISRCLLARDIRNKGGSQPLPNIHHNQMSSAPKSKPSPESILRRKTSFLKSVNSQDISLRYNKDSSIKHVVKIGDGKVTSFSKLEKVFDCENDGYLRNLNHDAETSFSEVSESTNPDISALADMLIAYHFCKYENIDTFSVPKFICTISRQLEKFIRQNVSSQVNDDAATNHYVTKEHDYPEALEHHFLTPLNRWIQANTNYKNKKCLITLDNLPLQDSNTKSHFGDMAQEFRKFLIETFIPRLPENVKLILTTTTNTTSSLHTRSSHFSNKSNNLCPPPLWNILGNNDLFPAIGLDDDDHKSADMIDNTSTKLRKDLEDYVWNRFDGPDSRCLFKNLIGNLLPDSLLNHPTRLHKTAGEPQNYARNNCVKFSLDSDRATHAKLYDTISSSASSELSHASSTTSSSSIRDATGEVQMAALRAADSLAVQRTRNCSTIQQMDYEQRLQAATMLPKLVDKLVDISDGSFSYLKHVLYLIGDGLLVIKNASFKVLPRSIVEIYQLLTNKAFPIASRFVREGFHVALLILASSEVPLTRHEFMGMLTQELKSNMSSHQVPKKPDLTCESDHNILEDAWADLNCNDDLSNNSCTTDLNSWTDSKEEVEGQDPKRMSDNVINYLIRHKLVEIYRDRLYLFEEHYGRWLVDEWMFTKWPRYNTSYGREIIGKYILSMINLNPNVDDYKLVRALKYVLSESAIRNETTDMELLFAIINNETVVQKAFLCPLNLRQPSLALNQLLLKFGANPNALIEVVPACNNFEDFQSSGVKPFKTPVLHWAISKHNLSDFVQLLCQEGAADPFVKNQFGNNAFVIAGACGNLNALRYLLKYCQNSSKLWERNNVNLNFLEVAILNDNREIVNHVLYHLQCHEIEPKIIGDALILACVTANIQLSKMIINFAKQRGNTVSSSSQTLPNNYQITPLTAVILGRDVLEGLNKTSNKDEPNLIKNFNNIQGARKLDLVKILVERNSMPPLQQPNYCTWDLENPYLCAVLSGESDILEFLLQEHEKNKSLRNPLHNKLPSSSIKPISKQRSLFSTAAALGNVECLKILNKFGLNDNNVDENGWSCLHWSSFLGRVETCQYIIEDKRYLTKLVDKNGRTPLQVAAMAGRIKIVEALMERDDDLIESLDTKGMSAIDLTIQAYVRDLEKCLRLDQTHAINLLSSEYSDTTLEPDLLASFFVSFENPLLRHNAPANYVQTTEYFLLKGAKIRNTAWKLMKHALEQMNQSFIAFDEFDEERQRRNVMPVASETQSTRYVEVYRKILQLHLLFLNKIVRDAKSLLHNHFENVHANADGSQGERMLADIVFRLEYSLKKIPDRPGTSKDAGRSSESGMVAIIANESIWQEFDELSIAIYLYLLRCNIVKKNLVEALNYVTRILKIKPDYPEINQIKIALTHNLKHKSFSNFPNKVAIDVPN